MLVPSGRLALHRGGASGTSHGTLGNRRLIFVSAHTGTHVNTHPDAGIDARRLKLVCSSLPRPSRHWCTHRQLQAHLPHLPRRRRLMVARVGLLASLLAFYLLSLMMVLYLEV